MAGTFSSLSTAFSAIRYNRVAMDVASGNVANVGTEGYARRGVVGQATGAPAAPAMWSRWDGVGDGVTVGSVDRMVDPFLDARARIEHGTQSFLDTRAEALVRLETTLGEPGDTGVAAALTGFQNAWHDVANNPNDVAARGQVLAKAETLTAVLGAQARAVTGETENQRARLSATITEVNDIAKDLASINESISVAEVTGTDAGILLDKRDALSMRLAELVGARSTMGTDGILTVTVNGQTLVQGKDAFQIDGPDDVTVDGSAHVAFSLGGQQFTAGGGELGGQLQLLNTDLPGYLGALDAFTTNMAAKVNDLHDDGQDMQDPPQQGGVFFASSTGGPITAASITVAITDPSLVAAATVGGGTYDASNATAMATADIGAGAYRQLIADFGTTVASSRRIAESQGVLTAQVDASRESLSGINIDEEMVNLLAAQRAYEGAARVLTTLDSVLDTLINRTGVTR